MKKLFACSASFIVKNDLWAFKIHKCPADCNHQGVCMHGHCTCFDGFYGIDCSNSSCPGDFCYYDEVTQIQVRLFYFSLYRMTEYLYVLMVFYCDYYFRSPSDAVF